MIGIYAGRFQPFHLGHFEAIQHILGKCDETYVLICSKKGDNPLDDRNPFTYEERKDMMRFYSNKVHFRHIRDQDNDSEWTDVIEVSMPKGRKVSFTNNPNTAKAFHQHGYEVQSIPEKQDGLNATLIRTKIIRNEPWKQYVPHGTQEVVDSIQKGSYRVDNTDY